MWLDMIFWVYLLISESETIQEKNSKLGVPNAMEIEMKIALPIFKFPNRKNLRKFGVFPCEMIKYERIWQL